MKKFRRILGGALMALSAIPFIVVLWNLIVRFDKEVSTASNLTMLAVYGLFFFLGYKIFGFEKPDKAKKNRPAAAPDPKKQAPAAQPAPRQHTVPVRAQADRMNAPAKEGKNSENWVPREGRVILYSDQGAPSTHKPALRSLGLMCDQGVPVMFYLTGRDDGHGGDTDGKRAKLPQDLLGDLNTQSLMGWLRDMLEGMAEDVDWTAIADAPGLKEWIAEVRRAAELELPQSLYPVKNPFEPELKDLGPDGLRERSAERVWVGKKNDTDITRALEALLKWQEEHRDEAGAREAWLMIRSNKAAEGAAAPELSARCAAAGVKLATRRGDKLHEYLTEKDYRLYAAEYPGQADDAATYGEWDLIPADKKTPQTADRPKTAEAPAAKKTEPAAETPAMGGTLDDITFIRDMRSGMSGPWHQYDILLAARPYGWGTMVDWAAYMASADIHHIGTVTAGDLGLSSREMIDAFRESGEDLKKMKELEYEQGYLAIGGSSWTLSDLVKIVWINQTSTMRIFTMRDQDERIRAYIETAVRRTFGTPDAMKVGRPIPEKKA